jgi:uncharacterized membrane-anchored protein YhcB (DUF1043 family)
VISSATSWLKDHLGIVLVSILLAIFSPIFTDILPNKEVSTWPKIALVAGNILLAVYTASSELRRISVQKQLSGAKEKWDAEQAESRRALNRRAHTLQTLSNSVAEAVADLRVSFQDLHAQGSPDADQVSATRQACVKTILRELCLVLAADRPTDTDPLKPTYFKATFFEYVPNPHTSGELKRQYWHYPDTIQPQTAHWDIDRDSNAAAVVAFMTRREVVLPDVAAAAADGSYWKDSRPRQHAEYAQSSMVCIPVFTETKETNDQSNPVLGVLTVDTNQVLYFNIGETARALRNEVFGPFLSLIRLAYAVSHKSENTRP